MHETHKYAKHSLLVALVCIGLASASIANAAEPAKTTPSVSNARKPKTDAELKRWLENMIWYHGFSTDEVISATGLTAGEIRTATQRWDIRPETRPAANPQAPLVTLPYPGGRHPRIGFLDGAINPQRETKLSIFTPWDPSSYVVADMPEAIWTNLGLTYLAHTHVPTVWMKRNLELEKTEWQLKPDGSLFTERTLPNGIYFSVLAIPTKSVVWFEMTVRNGSDQPLSGHTDQYKKHAGLRIQQCVMLKAAKGFNQQINDNKLVDSEKNAGSPYVAARNADGNRWIITAWNPMESAWANPPCPCIHSDALIPPIPVGETRTARGLVAFYEGKDIQQEFKRLDKLDWQKALPGAKKPAVE
ncbi:MAG: hypothetical protein SGJ20_20795 [Planctomycetota bacterium]|nr:hypothetical protein [Planctomycetota bacterium]